jgi:PAS domain S-box-containing protein
VILLKDKKEGQMQELKSLSKENAELKARLAEAEELLSAITSGSVDAFVTNDQKVFTLKGADHAYRVLVETIIEGAATLMLDGAVMYCNSRLAAMLEIPLEHIIGKSILDFVFPEDVRKFKSFLRACEKKTARVEFQFKMNNGNALPVLVSCNALKLDLPGLCMVITDLTEQKRIEAELKKHRNHLEALVEERTRSLRENEFELEEAQLLAKAGSWAYDPVIQKSTWSKGMFHIWGLDPSLGLFPVADHQKYIHPDDYPRFESALKEALDQGVPYNLELRINRPDGIERTIITIFQPIIDASGRVVKLRGTNQDITDRKRTEEALASAHRQIQNIVDNTTALIYAFDLEERFVLANAAVAKLLNSTSAQMIGKRRHDFMPLADADWHEANDRKVLEAGRALEFEEQDGSITWLTTKFPLRDAEGKIYAVGGISTDITERKRAEEILKRDKETLDMLVKEQARTLAIAELKVERTKRLADVGVLAATIAHELRNPLSAVGLSAYHIKKITNDPRIEEHLSTIKERISEADQIINNVSSYSKIKAGRFQPVKINSVLKECIKEAEGRFPGQTVVVKMKMDQTEGLFIEADLFQLREIFNNILNNAFDAFNKNDGIINIESKADDSGVTFLVKDTGEGIDKENLEKIFDPFFTTKTKGTGLGLAVCHRLVLIHAGSIGIESDKGQGTRIKITLPIRAGGGR